MINIGYLPPEEEEKLVVFDFKRVIEVAEDLHWWFVLAATMMAAVGWVFIQRVPLGILFAGSLGTALALGPVLW
jgi:hypothetical protein